MGRLCKRGQDIQRRETRIFGDWAADLQTPLSDANSRIDFCCLSFLDCDGGNATILTNRMNGPCSVAQLARR